MTAEISETGAAIEIEIAGDVLNQPTKDKVLRDVRHILRLDDDLREFYRHTKTEKRLAWIAKNSAGRLLRSPSVFSAPSLLTKFAAIFFVKAHEQFVVQIVLTKSSNT
ncbi:MAG: hypothetical protein M3T96_07625, partial [Acidobacteriota bacterium]|nr:hypothetical protein [Acidobacteriota bacterium]